MKSNLYNVGNDYAHYVVNNDAPLLEYLIENLNESRTKIKSILQVGE